VPFNFVKQGGYELHLRRLRGALQSQRDCVTNVVAAMR